MNKKNLFTGMALLIYISVFSTGLHSARADALANAKTLVLYDSTSGTIPDSSLMSFTAFPPDAASLTYTDGAILDTTPLSMDAYAGWVSSAATTAGFPVLDRMTGAQVNFTLQLENETHANSNRSGFNVIVLDKDARGIELAFWQNEIWAQNDDTAGGLFTHGEGVAFATTTAVVDYQIVLNADTYTLNANAVPILSGPLRDYSRFEGFIDPYETPNFVFFGDNTTSAKARLRLSFVSVTGTEPVAPATVTGASTDIPQPMASDTALPSATPVPSSTPDPAARVVELCPSGWLLVFAVIGNSFLLKKRRYTG